GARNRRKARRICEWTAEAFARCSRVFGVQRKNAPVGGHGRRLPARGLWLSFPAPRCCAFPCSSLPERQCGCRCGRAVAPRSWKCSAGSWRCAVTFAGAVVVKAAGTRSHGGGEHETRGKRQRHGGSCNADGAVFERLAHDVQNVAREFGELVQEQYTIMSERNLTRPGNRSAADQHRVRNSVVWRAERAQADQSGASVEHARHTVNLGGLK